MVFVSLSVTVIPGRAQREPGISRFRVWSFGPSRNDGVERAFAGDDAYGFNFQTAPLSQTQLRDLAAHPREFCRERPALERIRGRRESRVPAAPAASCAVCWWHTSVVTTGSPEHPAFP